MRSTGRCKGRARALGPPQPSPTGEVVFAGRPVFFADRPVFCGVRSKRRGPGGAVA